VAADGLEVAVLVLPAEPDAALEEEGEALERTPPSGAKVGATLAEAEAAAALYASNVLLD
jgi:hypothetical protein